MQADWAASSSVELILPALFLARQASGMKHWGPWDWIGYSSMGLVALMLAIDGTMGNVPHFAALLPESLKSGRFQQDAPILFFLAGTLALIRGEIVSIRKPPYDLIEAPDAEQTTPIVAPAPIYFPTLSERLDRVYLGYSGSSVTLPIELNGREYSFHLHTYNHSESNSKFIALIIENDAEQFDLLKKIGASFGYYKKTFVDNSFSMQINSGTIPSSRRTMVFTGRLYIYTSTRMTPEQMVEVKGLFAKHGADDVVFEDLLRMIQVTSSYFGL